MNERLPQHVPERKEHLERFEFAGRSLPSENHPSRDEDSYIADSELGLAAVFDGMGGHAGGELASHTAMLSIKDEIGSWDVDDVDADEMIPASLVQAVRRAHNAVMEAGRVAGAPPGNEPGTTASVVKVHTFGDGRRVAYVANVGDSRVYIRHAGGELEQLSEDHDLLSNPVHRSHIEMMFNVKLSDDEVRRIRNALDRAEDKETLADGPERYVFSKRNIIASSLGNPTMVPDVRTWRQELATGDVLLVTSDGIHDNLTVQQIQDIVSQGDAPEQMVQALAHAAYEYAHAGKGRAKKDDMTAAIIKVS